ncbi:hypothetical protein M0R19_05755 [Candidatus Pacearchaeota archaeon]|nr:hypothetical protein [Candidatus Pacearchaeota archaeon]
MKFIINQYSNDIPQCRDAILETVIRHERWRETFKHMKENGRKDKFMSTGFNHREEGDWSYRDIEEEVWTIEITALEDLIYFISKYGDSFSDGTLIMLP